MKKSLIALAAFFLLTASLQAQNKLSIDQVYSAYLRNSGTIMENNQIKGYFFLYKSDQINKTTDEYTLQILDQNLNKVKEIKFEDSKKLNLLEASYNNNSLAFLFKNNDSKTLDMKIYDLDGNLKFTYTRDYTKKTEFLMNQYATLRTDEGTNQNVYNVGEKGYVSVLPLKDGKMATYELDYYSSENKKQWSFQPDDDKDRFAQAEFMGSTGDLILLSVMRKPRMMSQKVTSHLVGININNRKKVFDIENPDDGEFKFVPTSILPVEGKDEIVLMGSYFDQKANIAKDFSKGLAIYTINGKGKVLSKNLLSWTEDFSRFLPVNKKGKLDDVGFLYIHKMIPTPDGKTFVVSEGYKRQASVGGIAAKTLLAAAGAHTNAIGATKIVVTDIVVMELDKNYKIVNATVYDKTNNTVNGSGQSDVLSQHMIAMMVKMAGGFDYEFTTGEPDNSIFTICYSDWVKDKEYKGKTFNSIRYNGSSFSTDKVELKSGATRMRVLPAKPGSVMILEYFKKEKRMDLRLEKLG